MSAGLIAFIGLIYAYICGEQAFKGQYAMALIYFGYALGNGGMWWITKNGLHGG